MIHVVNIREHPGPGVYIGRWMPGHARSPLANPYRVSKDVEPESREEALQAYRRWLWERMNQPGEVRSELERLTAIARESDLYLRCWCKPLSCHGDVVKAAIEYLIRSHP